MLKKEREEIEPKGFGLYAEGYSMNSIAQQLGVNRNTINRWSKEFNWEKRKRDVRERIEKNLGKSVADLRTDSIKLIRASLKIYADKLLNGEVDVGAEAAAKFIKVLEDLSEKVEALEKQKDEGYTFEIINPVKPEYIPFIQPVFPVTKKLIGTKLVWAGNNVTAKPVFEGER
jgi:transposase-like protein